ncbi:MAG: cell division protein FtsQ/DivIB [Gammaproteobacteria bacterium]|nr:cell division protein FtsQ/DivIB [Gammaproteobacteria bacterium]
MRIFRTLLVLLSVLGVIWGGYWSYNWFISPMNMPLEHVVLQAPFQHVTKKTLDDDITPYVKKNFMTMDAERLQHKLRELPWVKKIQLRRVWPNTLVVTVTEQQALGKWENLGGVNVDGEIFKAQADSIPADLPVFVGPPDMSKSMVSHYHQFQAVLAKEKLKIVSVKVNPRHAWEIQLEGGTVIKLGQSQHQERLALVVKAWPTLTKEGTKTLRSVDARYTNGIATN